MEISKAKMEGYRVIGIKDTDKEKLANHNQSSFSVEQEVKPAEVPEVEVSAPETLSEPVETPVQIEAPAATEETVVEKPAAEEVKAPEEENIFDRITKESVAEPTVPKTPVTLETPAALDTPVVPGEPVQSVEGNIFDKPAVQEVVQVVPKVSPKEEAFDTPAVSVLETPSEFYGLKNDKEELIDNAKINSAIPVKEEKQSSANLGADALSALKSLIEENESLKAENSSLKSENESLKAKVTELAESLNIANARTKAAETTLNEAIQRDVKTLN